MKTHQISILPGSEGLWYSGCSPDGQYVSALTANSQAIMLFNTATQKWSELVRTVVNSPVWSSDSQYIYFDSYPTRNAAVFRVRIRDQKLERVWNLEGFLNRSHATNL